MLWVEDAMAAWLRVKLPELVRDCLVNARQPGRATAREPAPSASLSRPKMKIAHVAPLYESVPPKFYGGTERIIAYLVDGLVGLGHDVTLFASADAETQGDAGAGQGPGAAARSASAEIADRRASCHARRGAQPRRRFRHHPFPSQPFPAFPVLRAHAGAHGHDAARAPRLQRSGRRLSAAGRAFR